jgi:phosphatidate phosphatase APP1
MLINILMRNPLQRLVVDGIAALYRRLTHANPFPAAAPFFYLSATPRQLHLPMQAVLEHNGLPKGVLITKRVTGDATSEPVRDQFAYKTRKIEFILERLPHVNFTLIGDDGEKDPEVFHSIAARFPERIRDIWIRRVHRDSIRARFENQRDLSELLQPGT